MKLSKVNSIFLSGWWLMNHFITARSTKGHGIHSPAVYDFVTNVVRNRRKSDKYKFIEQHIQFQRVNKFKLKVEDFGAGSRFMSTQLRTISNIAKNAGISRKKGRLLYRIANYYKPQQILELGTSLGFSSYYMAAANDQGVVSTIDGNKSLVKEARKGADELGLKNINFVQGMFDEVLPSLLSSDTRMVFIDGNHTEEATINYFEKVTSVMKQGILILDDIYWSGEMHNAWKQIQLKSTCSIDLYWFGVVIFDDMLTPGTYKIRF